jgi:hypothetical protein
VRPKMLRLLGWAAVLAACVGCASPAGLAWRQRIRGPQLLAPRSEETVRQERADAERFDPYPQDDLGTPAVGGRPPEFSDPPAEPARARWLPF